MKASLNEGNPMSIESPSPQDPNSSLCFTIKPTSNLSPSSVTTSSSMNHLPEGYMSRSCEVYGTVIVPLAYSSLEHLSLAPGCEKKSKSHGLKASSPIGNALRFLVKLMRKTF